MKPDKPVPREAVLIVNAHSRRGAELFRDARAKLEMAGIRLIAAHGVKDPSKLDDRVREAVADGAPMVIIGGGDGSLSCAVDFVVDKQCVFALLPLGTANSFARTLGLPLDLDAAIDTIVNGRRKRVDVGVINGDYFVNSAAIGLSPMVAESVPHGLKKWLGRFGYLIWALWCLMRFRSFELIVEDGRETHKLKALEVRIANGGFHGGVEVVDDADVDSGEIIVQAVIGHARRTLIWSWFSTIFRLPARQQTVCDFRGRRMAVITKPSLPISIDGEVSARTPAVVEIAERAIEVVVPAEQPVSA
jgi:YegS/Rv2252/BmrU family lipid kinase